MKSQEPNDILKIQCICENMIDWTGDPDDESTLTVVEYEGFLHKIGDIAFPGFRRVGKRQKQHSSDPKMNLISVPDPRRTLAKEAPRRGERNLGLLRFCSGHHEGEIIHRLREAKSIMILVLNCPSC